jgi:hypothetical protein
MPMLWQMSSAESYHHMFDRYQTHRANSLERFLGVQFSRCPIRGFDTHREDDTKREKAKQRKLLLSSINTAVAISAHNFPEVRTLTPYRDDTPSPWCEYYESLNLHFDFDFFPLPSVGPCHFRFRAGGPIRGSRVGGGDCHSQHSGYDTAPVPFCRVARISQNSFSHDPPTCIPRDRQRAFASRSPFTTPPGAAPGPSSGGCCWAFPKSSPPCWAGSSWPTTHLGPTVYGVLFGVVAGMMVIISVKELLPTAHRYDPEDSLVATCYIVGMGAMALSLVLFIA